jgi:hypothetical protein
MTFSKAAESTVVWALGNTAFGLIQYSILVGGKIFGFPEYTPKDVINDGVIMFFCVAIMGAVWTDFVLSLSDKRYPKIALIVILLVPIAGLFLASNIYSHLRFNPGIHYNYFALMQFQNMLIWGAVAYCIGVKFAIFTKE